MNEKEQEIEKYIEGFTSDPEIINGITARIMYEIRMAVAERRKKVNMKNHD